MSTPIVDSTDQAASSTPSSGSSAGSAATPLLWREVVSPRERRSGVASFALACSVASIASGFALATSLAAGSMARASVPSRGYTHAFLGVNYHDEDGVTRIFGVVPQTGAAEVGIVPGDIVVSYDGEPVDQGGEFGALIRSSPIGHRPLVVLRRGETSLEVRPMLSAIVHRAP